MGNDVYPNGGFGTKCHFYTTFAKPTLPAREILRKQKLRQLETIIAEQCYTPNSPFLIQPGWG